MTSRFRAVIFDLFGTLIPSMSPSAFENTLHKMANNVSADPVEFTRQWIYDTWDKRRTGGFKTVEENILSICQILGLRPSPMDLSKATDVRYEYARSLLLNPVNDAVETLDSLKSKGYKTGLLSNCSADIPYLWPETRLSRFIDAPVFSCSIGHAKPDPASYRLAATRLQVNPESCAYVGDGSDRELTGAQAVGMHPILISGGGKDPYDEQVDRVRWNGPVINELGSLLPLLF